jgi:hypothetical protein
LTVYSQGLIDLVHLRHISRGYLKKIANQWAVMKKKKMWVAHVQETSNAMDIPLGLFTRSSKEIAKGLEKAVLESTRTKGTKFQSAMSMLNYYINRAGKKLPVADKERLEAAKNELRKLFGKL